MKRRIIILTIVVLVFSICMTGCGGVSNRLKQWTCKHEYSEEDRTLTKPPTCTKRGEELWVCSICGHEETVYTSILEHTWGEGVVTTAPTCTESGKIEYACEHCVVRKLQAIPALGHTLVFYSAAVEATCYKEGQTEVAKCEVCGYMSTPTVIPKLPHPFDENGFCTVCGEDDGTWTDFY